MLGDEENFVKVPLQDEYQQASLALKALTQIGVKASLVSLVPANGQAAAVVLRIRHDRLAEAICSLQYFGFRCVESEPVSGAGAS